MAQLLNDDLEEQYTKGTLYGKSGAGKTTLGCTAPRPLILLSERQGFRSVRDAARRLGIPLPPTIWVQSLTDVRHILAALQSDPVAPIATALRRTLKDAVDANGEAVDVEAFIATLPYQKPETIILDSATEMFALISDDIERTAGKKIGRDGLEAKPERYWGVLRDRSEKMIRSFRDLPYHVFFLALLKDATIGEGEEQSRVVEPACPMKALPGALAAAVNVVGIVSVAQEPRKVEGPDGESSIVYDYKRWVRFAGPSWMLLKAMEPLGTYEPPNIAGWLTRIEHDEPTDTPLDLGGVGAAPATDDAPPDDAPDDAPDDTDDDTATADADTSADGEGDAADAAPDDDAAATDAAAQGDDDGATDTPPEESKPEPKRSTTRRRRRRQASENANQ